MPVMCSAKQNRQQAIVVYYPHKYTVLKRVILHTLMVEKTFLTLLVQRWLLFFAKNAANLHNAPLSVCQFLAKNLPTSVSYWQENSFSLSQWGSYSGSYLYRWVQRYCLKDNHEGNLAIQRPKIIKLKMFVVLLSNDTIISNLHAKTPNFWAVQSFFSTLSLLTGKWFLQDY